METEEKVDGGAMPSQQHQRHGQHICVRLGQALAQNQTMSGKVVCKAHCQSTRGCDGPSNRHRPQEQGICSVCLPQCSCTAF